MPSKTVKHFFMAAGTAFVLFGTVPSWAGNPTSAAYCQEDDRIFWFITITDTHIGTSGSQDTDNLSWVVHEGKSVVNPSFIMLAGDITDSTNGNFLGIPNGPYQSEWDQYRATLDMAHTGINAGNFFDIPGNHDAYNDKYFSYYLSNSVQGQAAGRTQVSWTRQFAYGTYHFLGVNTSANDGAAFSLSFPYGDYAGLDSDELSYIGSELALHSDAELTFIFGHHPLESTGHSDDTWVFYGADELASMMENYGVSSYVYGHTHRFSEAFFTGGIEYDTGTSYQISPGVFYVNIASLGKSSDNHFNVTAVDCNGISMKTQAIGNWPIVMITTPMDINLGKPANPLVQYAIPNGTGNPLRALLFDPDTSVSTAEYRIDGGTAWLPMSRAEINPYLWEASWDSSGLSEGDHTIEVRATGSEGTVRNDTITVYVEAGVTNTPPVATATADPTSGTAPLNVTFDGSGSTDADGTITSYLWDFGDGSTGNGVTTTHTYQTEGSYAATLTVTDDQGAQTTSSPIAINVTAAQNTIAAPTDLTASVEGNSVTLNWTDNSDNETGFDIYRAQKIKGKYNFTLIASTGTDSNTYTDTHVEVGTYKYKVQAKGTYAGGDIYSDFSNEVLVKVETSSTPAALSAPALSALVSGYSVTLTWAHDCPQGAACAYHVLRGDSKVRGKILFNEIATVNTLSYVVEEQSSGTYYYSVYATTDSGDTSDNSNTVTVRLR